MRNYDKGVTKMMNREFYQKHKECISNGNSETSTKSDVLLCKKHKGVCSLVKYKTIHENEGK